MGDINDFKKRSLDAALEGEAKFKGKKKTEEDLVNAIDENHTPIWQLVAFCDEEVFGFNNIMASMFYAKNTKSYSFNYRFMYSDGRKNWYNFMHKGSHWTPAKEFDVEKHKESMRQVMRLLEDKAGSKLKIRETEFTGQETMDEVMEIFARSGLVNMAKFDPKTKTVEVINENDFDELSL